jgi:hypothetical protein
VEYDSGLKKLISRKLPGGREEIYEKHDENSRYLLKFEKDTYSI